MRQFCLYRRLSLSFYPRDHRFRLSQLVLVGAVLAGWNSYATAEQRAAIPQTPVAVRNGSAQLTGQLDPAQRLRVVFVLKPPHLAEEEELLRQLHDQDSPLFHQWLTEQEWNERFAPSAQAEQAVITWAQSQGLTVTQRYGNRLLVDAEAPAAVIAKALNVSLNTYQIGGNSYFSNDTDPSLPAVLGNVVGAVLGLNNIAVARCATNLTDTGCDTLHVRTWDNAGQVSAGSGYYDDGPPYTYIGFLGNSGEGGFVGAVTVTLVADDGGGSGIAATYYRVDSGAWQTYTAAFTVASPGSHSVAFYSTDLAGNVEQTQTAELTITFNYLVTLTVTKTGSGSGLVSTGDGDIYCGSICTHQYYSGEQVQLLATPAHGSVISGWMGCDSSSGPNCTITPLSDTTVTAILNVPTALQFIPVSPCRVADTRNANGPFGGPPIQSEDYRDFVIPQSVCNIPTTAAAYSLNVTVVPHGSLGFLTIWPSGLDRPTNSTMNSYDGRVKANAAIVTAGNEQAISVYVSNTSDVVLDIDGYFVPASAQNGLAFYPLPPCRVVDTRWANGSLGGPYLTGNASPRAFPILDATSCNIPATAQAYSLNLTAVPRAGALWVLSAWPAGQLQPTSSTLNAPTGTVVANAEIVPAGSNGGVDVWASSDTDLAIDIDGYFAAPGTGGLSLYANSPCRVLDTRQSSGAFNGTLVVNVAGSSCDIPGSAQAYVFNATAIPTGAPLWFLALWPDGGTQPNISALNAWDGAVTSNMAIVPTSNGSIDADAAGLTQLTLDISSYFAP